MIKRPVTIAQARQWPAAADRRRSFCARMGGMRDQLTGEETAGDPRSRINRALAAWDCDIPELLDRKHISRGIRMRKNPTDKSKIRVLLKRSAKYVGIDASIDRGGFVILDDPMSEWFKAFDSPDEALGYIQTLRLKKMDYGFPYPWESKRRKNPIRDDHTIAIEGDAGSGWIDSVNYPHENPRGRRKNPAPKRQQMARIRVTMPDGSKVIETVPILFRFTVYIGKSAEKFHARKDQFNQLVVSEESTGLSVGTVPAMTRAAAGGSDRIAAKSFVEKTAERVGAEKFRAAIAKAGPL